MEYNLSNRSMLKQVSQPWTFDNDESVKLKSLMLDIMIANNGIGLAANQIGLDKQVFVMGADNSLDLPKPFILFNPKVLEFKGTTSKNKEGCLSFPNLWLDIERNRHIIVEYQDEEANIKELELFNLAAICFQHELDHLSGICFVDKVSQLKLQLAMKKMRKLR